ncbi:MAG: carboxypeptidase-like regulatory domain-containing protein [Acidobacteriia bacterium]|nr:carboxypeptidase-like regulatory domain-containing protein [Terriglobia bacterium]
MALQFKSGLIFLTCVALSCASLCPGQTSPQEPIPGPPGEQSPDQRQAGSISGTVVDGSGAVVAGARVSLTREDQSPERDALSGDDGQFSFANVAPGPFQLTITAAGFATQSSNGILRSGEVHVVPPIALPVASTETDVQVVLSPPEVAEAQVKDEEKQRVLRVIPNFYVTYDPHPVALSPKQKFELAWKTSIDPFTFGVVGAIAGLQQAQNDFSGYGQGTQGYAKRYGASYANVVSGTFLGSAILPSLLKQDPRYFYKGTGTRRSRILYALANAVICKGDNGHWQANYSNILGNFAAGGISNLYYPAEDRNGAGLTFENGLIGIGATGAANLFQEFVVKKLSRNGTNHAPPNP